MGNAGFRINKYLKVSIILGTIDLVIFYIVGKIFNNISLFNLIMLKWQYITLFISGFTIFIYFVDIMLFRKRKIKQKFLFKDNPFSKWKEYIDVDLIEIRKKDKQKNFYNDIYFKVKNHEKIKSIMQDEILLRDLAVHMITTNVVLLIVLCILDKLNPIFFIECLSFVTIIFGFLVFAYRNYVKYYINEIYIDYVNLDK